MRTKSFTEPVEYILSSDPDCDLSHPDWKPDEYVKTFDPKWRPIKEGGRPARYRIAPLTRTAKRRLQKLEQSDMLNEAAECALVGVRDWDHNGTPVVLDEKSFVTVDGVRRLSPSWLDLYFFPEVLSEVGGVAISISMLHPFT